MRMRNRRAGLKVGYSGNAYLTMPDNRHEALEALEVDRSEAEFLLTSQVLDRHHKNIPIHFAPQTSVVVPVRVTKGTDQLFN